MPAAGGELRRVERRRQAGRQERERVGGHETVTEPSTSVSERPATTQPRRR